MHADVADRGGEVRAEIEQDLGLPAAIRAARDPLAERENRDQLPVGDQGDRHDRLQHRHLAHDLPGGGVAGPSMRLVDLRSSRPSTVSQSGRPLSAGSVEGLDDVRDEARDRRATRYWRPAWSASRIALRLGRAISATASRNRSSTRGRSKPAASALANSLAIWVKACGEASIPRRLSSRCRRPRSGRPDGAERGHLLQKAELRLGLPEERLADAAR